MPDRTPGGQPTSARPVTFEVDMARVESVTLVLPDGAGVDDLDPTRPDSWPDAVLEVIEQAVSDQLLDFPGWKLAQNITRISHSGTSETP